MTNRLIVEQWQMGENVWHCEKCGKRLEVGDWVVSISMEGEEEVLGMDLCPECAEELGHVLISGETEPKLTVKVIGKNGTVTCVAGVEQEMFDRAMEMYCSNSHFYLEGKNVEAVFDCGEVVSLKAEKEE